LTDICSDLKKRDFIHVDDVNDFHLLCIDEAKCEGKVFNIGSGLNYSVNQIYQMISTLLDVRITPVQKQDLSGEAKITLSDITEARKLGWQPKVDIYEGLKKMIEYIKEEIAKGRV